MRGGCQNPSTTNTGSHRAPTSRGHSNWLRSFYRSLICYTLCTSHRRSEPRQLLRKLGEFATFWRGFDRSPAIFVCAQVGDYLIPGSNNKNNNNNDNNNEKSTSYAVGGAIAGAVAMVRPFITLVCGLLSNSCRLLCARRSAASVATSCTREENGNGASRQLTTFR